VSQTTYATVQDVQDRMTRTLTADEQALCSTLLEDAAVMLDAKAPAASEAAKKIVSCRMVIRVVDSSSPISVPMGATQGSMSALGYQQSWTYGSGSGASGEMYLSKADRQLLGAGNAVGSYSPVQELVPEAEP
jgi:hypothetical protein